MLFEFCCDEESNLGKVGNELGFQVVRLCKESIDLSSDHSIEQLCEQVKALPGCSIHGSIECRPWSTWQRLNMKKHPRLCQKIAKDCEESLLMIGRFIKVADLVLSQGGHVSFEWPGFCAGWTEEPLASRIVSKHLFSTCFPGCAVGVTAENDEPAARPWRIVTSSQRLADSLSSLRCTHDKHAKLHGKYTRLFAFYPKPLCRAIVTNRNIVSMPCVPQQSSSHRNKLVPAWPSMPTDVLMLETGMKQIRTAAFVHRLLDRNEWKGRPEVQKAIDSERNGLL